MVWGINHSSLLKMYGIVLHPLHGMVVVMEYADGGTLHSACIAAAYESDGGEAPPLKQLLKWLLEIADGVRVLHSLNIVHCDIKPANILLKNNVATLADFGLAGTVQSVTTATGGYSVVGSGKGTPRFKPPELAKKKKWTGKGDVYSFRWLCTAC